MYGWESGSHFRPCLCFQPAFFNRLCLTHFQKFPHLKWLLFTAQSPLFVFFCLCFKTSALPLMKIFFFVFFRLFFLRSLHYTELCFYSCTHTHAPTYMTVCIKCTWMHGWNRERESEGVGGDWERWIAKAKDNNRGPAVRPVIQIEIKLKHFNDKVLNAV